MRKYAFAVAQLLSMILLGFCFEAVDPRFECFMRAVLCIKIAIDVYRVLPRAWKSSKIGDGQKANKGEREGDRRASYKQTCIISGCT